VGRSAVSVGSGILLSRLTGFARDVAIGAFFGTGLAASAYNAALRIPNVIRNLLGEGTLSASFVPVYSALLEDADRASADRLARGILGVVIGLAGVLSALGVLAAPLLTRIVVPGWGPEAAALTTSLVRILFPMAGIMIVAAWALGVLNSHRSYFLPFAAPVLWNLAQIAGLLVGRWAGWEPLVVVLAWSTLAGSVLQLAVQLPEVARLLGRLRPSLSWSWEPVRRVVRNALPVISSQGIFQLSSLMELVLASALPTAAVAGLYYGQRLAYLPLSLFGVSVATASLPEMSREREVPEALRRRLRDGYFQILWFVFPAAVALILFGDLMVALLFQRGAFGPDSTQLVAAILVPYALGLVATSSVKLFAGGFHALQDTKTPLKYAAAAVTTGLVVGAGLMFWARAAGMGAVAVAGLLTGGALGAWLNLVLLWRGLRARVGAFLAGRDVRRTLRVVLAAAAGGLAGHLARGWLASVVPPDDLIGRGLVLAGTLLAAGVPYLLAAGRPPRGVDPSHDRDDETRPDRTAEG
jgi:putative peptidoglycan lipid II flippase